MLRLVNPFTVFLKPECFSLLIISIMISFPLYAQRSCGTPEAIKDAMVKYPARAALYRQHQLQTTDVKNIQQYSRGGAVVVIPVVVHIVLPDPNQISDEQVQSQINVLNTDYNAENADSLETPMIWKSLFGDMRIQFCLAERTPEGDPTNGIQRVKTNVSQFTIANGVSGVKHVSTGGADAWDSKEYMNIWVCDMGSSTLGVGTPPGLYPDDEDGIVVQYDAFGTEGNLLPAFNKGRTCTHEVGHYFNLLHPWGNGDGSCSPGDYVADTPPQSNPIYGCPVFPVLTDNCSPNYPGVMFMNFMGYANDTCMSLFTLGQVVRAQAGLFNYHSSLLSSDGCQPVILKTRDAAILHVLSPQDKVCDNLIAPEISIKNRGKQTLSSLNISYQIDQGPITHFAWTGSLASLDTLKLALPSTSLQIGNHTFTVYTAGPNGLKDENIHNDTAISSFHLDPVATAPFSEGFESDSFPPPGWEIRNPDGALTWEKTSIAAYDGKSAVVMRNLDYAQNGPTDDLITPVFDLQNADSAFLFFYVAAAVQSAPNSGNQYWDTLQVILSNDCAQSGISLYKKWGPNLITDSVPTSQEFVPNHSQWRRDSIDLTPYLRNGQFQIIFRNITNFENNIYLDDINIVSKETNPVLKKEKVIVVPNPTTGALYVQFLSPPPSLEAVAVYNSLGQVLYRKNASSLNNQNRIEFNLADAANGVYFVKIFYSDHTLVRKIVKIK